MSKKVNWNGLLKVLEIRHLDAEGNVLYEQKNILNVLHLDGEEYLLRAAFQGGAVSTIIPDDYYLGMDNRSAVSTEDTMDDLVGEPGGSGYERQAISSSGDFALNFERDHFVATSPIVAFRATTGNWGPVGQIFLTDKEDNTGYLIATASLNTAIEVISGNSVTARIGLQLRDCDSCDST
jgi:hypothetical protein